MALKITIPPLVAQYLNPLRSIARRHYFVSLVLVLGGLAYGVYSVNQVLSMPQDNAYRQERMQASTTTFTASDEEVIAQIEALQKSTDASGELPPFPAGRINPFAE